MHKQLFGLTVCMLLFASTAQAQLKIGIKAGALISNISDGGISLASGSEVDTRYAYLTGVVLTYPVFAKWDVRTELLYIKKGYQIAGFGVMGDFTNNLHYISLPILLQYKITDRFSVGAGPEIGYLISSYQNSDVLGNSSLDFFKPFEVGIALNVQYQIFDQLAAGLRYSIGLSDITKRVESSSTEGTIVIDNDVYNRSLQLSLLYWLK